MTLRFTIPNSGITIEGLNADTLTANYLELGGSVEFLHAHMQRAITAMEHGGAIATAQASLGGEVISDEPSDPDADTAVVDDPWASHPSERTTQPAKKPGPPAAGPHRGDPAAYLGEDRFANKFYTDANAPECDCGVKAIRKAGRAGPNAKVPGKPYSQYVCFDAGPKDAGADYRNKCSFSEFINTPKGR